MKSEDCLGESSSVDSSLISGIKINDIKSLLYMSFEYKNMSSDDLKKDINSGSQLQSLGTTDYFKISSTKELKESQYDNNLSANGLATKKPTEQDDYLLLVSNNFCTSKSSMDSPIIPCDGETTDGKTETSKNNDYLLLVSNNFCTSKSSMDSPIVPCDVETNDGKTDTSKNDGTKKESNKEGEGVPVECQHELAGRRNNASSSSGGGGDDGDERKPHVPLSSCKRDDQASEGDKKDEVEDAEIVANAEETGDGGGNDDDEDVDNDYKVEPAEERKGIEDIGIPGCDNNEDEGNQVNNQVSSVQIASLTCTASECSGPPPICARETSAASLEKVKKFNRPDLKVDIAQAKAMQAASCPPDSSYQDTEGNFEALEHLEEAFACRYNMRAWEECGDENCRALQQFLRHTRNCHMRVLGGCRQCISFKDALQSHASTCKELLGKCVVNKCDNIREYMKNNPLPDNKNWKYKHDQLFFEPSPPRTATVTWPRNLCLLPFEAGESTSIDSSTGENSSARATTYNVVREPDFGSDLFSGVNLIPHHLQSVEQPADCSARSVMASWQPIRVDEEDVVSASPLSAASMPDLSQASGGVPITQEVLWPLNGAHLSVGDDGTYLENVHWQQNIYIGRGSNGCCYQCMDLETQKLFAVKRIREDKFEMNGLEIWGILSGKHKNILELFGAVKTCGEIIIFMEYMSGGSVEEAGKLHEGLAIFIFSKMLSAVEFMHSLGFVHRDIKGANFLINSTGEKVKLADFDTSIRLDNGYQQDNNPRGTEAFMAPEVCRSENHSSSVDIWSLMCVLYQMLRGIPPWEQYHRFPRETLLYKIAIASEPPPSPVCSPEVEDLFSLGFQLKPEERSTATALLNHRLFNSAPAGSNMELPRSSSIHDYDYESNLCSALEFSDVDDDDESYENDTRRGDASSVDADIDEDDNDDAEDGDDDYEDDDIGAGGGANGSSYASDSEVSRTEGDWPGQRSTALSTEQQLHSLQSDLFYSLPAEELSRMIVDEISEDSCLTDNEVNLALSSEEDFDYQSIMDQISMVASQASRPDGSYSVADLTKVHIKDIDGNIMFSIRERPTTTFGTLARDLHGNIANVSGIDEFVLVQDDVSPLDVHAEIGEHEQSLRVFRAYDTDYWQPFRWRVNTHGIVEQSDPA